MPAGRPTDYTPELAKKICRAIATSTKGLEHICAENENFPGKTAIYDWLYDYHEFAEQYAIARAQQADLFVDEMTEIANNETEDLIATKEGYVGNSTKVARDRLRIDTIKWKACKLIPKVYGEKSEVKSDVTVTMHEDMLKQLE